MDRAWANSAAKLHFKDPTLFLKNLCPIGRQLANSDLPKQSKSLRTHNLKPWREAREAALFYQGMGPQIGQTVYFALNELQDYEFVASCIVGNKRLLAPVR